MIQVDSEIGRLQAVLVHRPGREIENMTPSTAAEVLYDDILNRELAVREHDQLTRVLGQVARVLEFSSLLEEVLQDEAIRFKLLKKLTRLYHCRDMLDDLMQLPVDVLVRQLFEGTERPRNTLSRYLDPVPYILPPLPNAFFTRDATMCANDRVIIGSMAHRVRVAEAMLLKVLFKHHPALENRGFYFDGTKRNKKPEGITIEGGDLLMVRKDVALIGYSERTSIEGIDRLMAAFAQEGRIRQVIVVEMPKSRATIHLDMIFTLLDQDQCMVFPPLILGRERCRAWRVELQRPCDYRIQEYDGVLDALRAVGVALQPIKCGGEDPLNQEREQWASGANFFTFAPGQIVGYAQNVHTMEALSDAGYSVVNANDYQAAEHQGRVVVGIEGSELSRGGGGCRCMTMPLERQPL